MGVLHNPKEESRSASVYQERYFTTLKVVIDTYQFFDLVTHQPLNSSLIYFSECLNMYFEKYCALSV